MAGAEPQDAEQRQQTPSPSTPRTSACSAPLWSPMRIEEEFSIPNDTRVPAK